MADENRQTAGTRPDRFQVARGKGLLSRALSVTLNHRQLKNRATALEALIPHLPGDLLERSLDAVLGIMKDNPETSLGPLMALATRLPAQLLADLPSRAGTRTPFRFGGIFDGLFPRETWTGNPKDIYVWAAVTLFKSENRSEGAHDALAVTGKLDNRHDRGLLIAALLPYLPSDAFDSVLDLLSATEDSYPYDDPFIALAKHAPVGRLGDLLEFAAVKWTPVAEFFRQIAPRLTVQHTPAALRLCQKVSRKTTAR